MGEIRQQTLDSTRKATFAAGCFWGIEDTFRQVEGVVSTRVGYSGGQTEAPSYKDVCSGTTGHAEAVEITFDPNRVSFDQLLERFWDSHDPTTLNRQGPDIGSQYRSVIFFHDDDQRVLAERSKEAANLQGRFRRPIVTEIVPAPVFYEAEDYHQQYFEKQGISSCRLPR